MSTPHDALLTFEYDDESRARLVERSIRPELGEIDDDRSRAGVERANAELSVGIEADDPIALRAALNTWCSFIDVVETTVEAGERAGG